MTEKKSDFQSALKHLMEEERRQRPPLDAEQVFAYYEAEPNLSEAEKSAYLERFLADPQAAKALLALKSFPAEEAPAMDAAELETSWQGFQREVEANAPLKTSSAPPRAKTSFILGTLAASLFLATVGFFNQNLALKRDLEANRVARFSNLNRDVTDIYFNQEFRSEDPENQLTHGEEILIIHMGTSEYPRYRIVVFDGSGAAVRTLEDRPYQEDRLIFILDRRDFPGDQYEFELAGLKNGKATRLRRFQLNWRSP